MNPTDTQVCKEGRKGLLKCCQTFSEEPPTGQVEAQRTKLSMWQLQPELFLQGFVEDAYQEGAPNIFPITSLLF